MIITVLHATRSSLVDKNLKNGMNRMPMGSQDFSNNQKCAYKISISENAHWYRKNWSECHFYLKDMPKN